ncbi:unnamed protein product [Ectocarpus sp. CCAP 1310/34]|nr:unnamed protein product [Ectocarpus sp. CCAP 1310/34]
MVDDGQGSLQAVGGSRTEVVEEADAARSGQSAHGGNEEETIEGRASGRRPAGAGGGEGDGGESGGGDEEEGARAGVQVAGKVVPDFRLNGFVYVCPLVSGGCTFTAKAWLQDEDD